MPEFKTPEKAELGLRKCRCGICCKIILHKEPRIMKYGNYKTYRYKYYFCIKCGKRIIEDYIMELKIEIRRLRKMNKGLDKLKEKNKDIMILSNLENQNERKNR